MARRVDTPRDLLLGLLALQTGMVNQAQLVAAFQAWSLDKARPMGDLLVEHGALDADGRDLLTALARKHLEIHRGDPEKSLAALGAGRSTRESLAGIGDPEIDATMAHVGSGSGDGDGESDRTASFSVGTSTSGGQRFRILRPHAMGGLGAVFVALDGELHREVALKQIQDRHADDPVSRGRFLVEAEITGGLEHPGIVPVYGLGSYADGRPYYAMRFIRGESLKEAIAAFHAGEGRRGDPGARGLGLRKLLRRFLDVCNAIEYAHRRGVLHRDLKPGNVMVGKYGETLVVDWGLAKAVGRADHGGPPEEPTFISTAAAGSSETLPGSVQGSPAYMSPEQAAGDQDRLGPASDVYSLGATLYCLLTGRPPFEGDDVGAILRAVRKGEFPPPRARDRSIAPALEAICIKAMALHPEGRYASPRELADDIDRWMADEPVSARREPVAERVRRWMRRRRTLVTAASAAILVGVVGLSLLLVVQTRANRELRASNAREVLARDQALARFDLAMEAIKMFHTGVSEDLLLKEKEFDALRTKLLRGAREFYGRLGGLLKEHPDRASRKALGQAGFEVAGLTARISSQPEAIAAHREALAMRQALAMEPGADAGSKADVARSLMAIASLQSATGDRAEALKSLEEARSLLEAIVRSDPAIDAYRSDLARSIGLIGIIQAATSKPGEALASYRRALGIQQELAEAHPEVLAFRRGLASCCNTLAIQLAETGKREEAVASFERTLAIRRELAAANPDDLGLRRDLGWSLNNTGSMLWNTGDPARSLALHEQALAIRTELAEANPSVNEFQRDLAWSDNLIATNRWEAGRRSEALELFGRALTIRQRLAEANPDVTEFQIDLAMSHYNIGEVMKRTGRPVEAMAAYGRALAIRQRLAEAHPEVTEFRKDLATSYNNHGTLLAVQGKHPEALISFGRAIAILQEIAGANPQLIALQRELGHSHFNVGRLMRLGGKYPESLVSFGRALAIREKLAKDYPDGDDFRRDLINCHAHIGSSLQAMGRPAEARGAYERAIAILEHLTVSPSNLKELACGHGLLSGLAGMSGSGITAAQGRAQADRAMDALRRAVAAGYRDVAELRKETDLDPIRSRDDFKLLILDLEFPSDPFGG